MKIKELLSKREAWTQGTYAKTRDGFATHADSEFAVCWCLAGAARKCYGVGTAVYCDICVSNFGWAR